MLIVGLTGGLGTGKSTAARMFADLGAHVVDADAIARQALEPGADSFQKTVERFGQDILENGKINRAKLAEIVFKDPAELEALEKIVHPVVRTETLRRFEEIRRQDAEAVVIWDIPLLFEKGLDKDADTVIVVSAAKDRQIARAAERLKISREDVLRRMDRQMPLEDKIRRAGFVIRNDGSLEHTQEQVFNIWTQLKHFQRS